MLVQVEEKQARENAILRQRRSRVKRRIQDNLKMAAMVKADLGFQLGRVRTSALGTVLFRVKECISRDRANR